MRHPTRHHSSFVVRPTARLCIEIHGAVQGVGFRPFVYRLATELDLAGWVINDTRGVFIEVEGSHEQLEQFLERLANEPPPRAIIHTLASQWHAPSGYTGFEIRHSDDHGAKTALILPDIATCPDCLAEVLDPANRRYGYPFTNCTNCGPRLTIIQALPYDRPNTTMRPFTMCSACQAEYQSPLDRRFHAQPNACAVCGPHLELWQMDDRPFDIAQGERPTTDGGEIPVVGGQWSGVAKQDAALKSAAAALRAGEILAVKGLGGFHLMVDARNAAAVARLRARKPREEKPFALMVRNLDQARAICEVSAAEAALLAGPEAPIVLLRRIVAAEDAVQTRQASNDGASAQSDLPDLTSPAISVADNVAPGNPYLGVMLPYAPLHHLLLRVVDFPVVATSGNLTDEPICTDEREAVARLGQIADHFLVHNRPIERHVDDSVAAVVLGAPRLLRRARGYAPLPVLLKHEAPCILAVGGHLKNTIALSVGKQVFISQHIGDLETPQAIAAFERVIADFLRLYEAAPLAIAHDMHPDYASTCFAEGLGTGDWGLEDGQAQSPVPNLQSLIPVQHHHAHLAACLAENGVDGPALGVTWDGTGYGTDGTIWGGEFLLGDAAGFTRVAHLRPFRLPGGEAAVKQPGRIALALLFESFGAAILQGDLPPVAAFHPTERHILGQMLQRDLHTPITTSAGRLFDGIAAMIGLRQHVSFEGQAAMNLEWITDTTIMDAYPIDLLPDATPSRAAIVDWRPLVAAVLADMRRGVERGVIAARFHNALVESIAAVAVHVGVPRIVLTGGCFLNRLLVERAARRLTAHGFEVLLHRQVPPGDGGISLGQIAVAAARQRRT